MKKIVLTIIIGIFLLSFATAAIPHLGYFKRFECVDIPQTCPDCTYNNITKITNVDLVVVQTEVPMDKDDTTYNYTFCNTTILGLYTISGHGDIGGTRDTWECQFDVTETGYKDLSVLNNPLLIMLVALALIFLFIGITTGTLWFGFMSATMFLLSGIYTTIYGLNYITDMYTRGAGIALIGVGIVIMFVAVYEGFMDDD